MLTVSSGQLDLPGKMGNVGRNKFQLISILLASPYGTC